jgi:folate-binding Fe-S cluster repair protein YgfZ
MYAPYTMRRTQIYLDEGQETILAARAQTLGRTRSALIREAIHAYLAPQGADEIGVTRLRAAVGEAFGVAPHLGAGSDYVERLRAADAERERALDERRG